MTFKELKKLLEDNHIPDDVHFESDSGWECGPTEMDGVFYNKEKNTIVFTQGCWGDNEDYLTIEGFQTLKNEDRRLSYD